MALNTQAQKIVNPQATRIRHRRRATNDARMISRQPGLANFLSREATRANAADQRIASIAVNAGGTGYVVGEQFTISGGTGTITAVGMVSAESAGVVTAVVLIDPGAYTVAPGTGAATAAAKTKNGTTPGTGLTVNATALTSVPSGVTGTELLDGLKSETDLSGAIPTITRARHFRTPRNSSDTYTNNGVPVV